jgi:hypothetical protein
MQTRLAVALAAAAPLLWAPARSHAQDFMSRDFIAPGTETWTIDLGGILNRFDSTLRLDGENSRGTDINLENNDLDRNLSSFEAGLTWRFLPRHRLDALYYGAKRDGSRDVSGEVDIGDATFPVGANVTVHSKNEIFDVNYRYSIVKDPGHEIGLLAGLYGGKVSYDVDAVGVSNGGQRTFHKSVSTTIPLPVLGASFDWYPDLQWKLSAEFAGMKAKIGDVDGHAYLAAAAVEYMIVRNLGVGLRYGYTDVKADVTKDNFNGTLAFKINAVSAYAKFVF